ncbi:hypothetical protein [Aeromonas sp. BIGb0445]|uniref:hypothetical protein n=1 Tax=Aeromonas sp. BIGb0445 TaxID=2940593 RepID=UPI0021676B1E|nr:hypothetical protein [Aeromonas sp. BIGb0445]MCS3458492.1 hypothetical protein [Aeromonas sp. BIGb0445]
MSNNILSRDRVPMQEPVAFDLNGLYHPPKRPLTALGIISAVMPMFGFGWQAMTGDPEQHFRDEVARRINRNRRDEANLILLLQIAALHDCRALTVALPYVLKAEQLARIRTRLPRWQIDCDGEQLQARLADEVV